MSELVLTPASPNDREDDYLRIHHNRGKVNGKLSIFKFTDKDTKQLVLFAPSLNISSYGETQDKAYEMIKSSIIDLFDHFVTLSKKELEKQLRELGWEKARLKNKEFSQMAVAIDGALENLNAFEDKVERFALVA
jgi:hypothetical protein